MDKYTPQFDVAINGRVYKVDLDIELKVNTNNLLKELMEQSAKYARFSSMYEISKVLLARREHELEKLSAKLDFEIRKNWKYGFKCTESAIKQAILRDKRYIAFYKKVDVVRLQAGLLYAAKKSFEQRRDMLVQLSANQRQEETQY